LLVQGNDSPALGVPVPTTAWKNPEPFPSVLLRICRRPHLPDLLRHGLKKLFFFQFHLLWLVRERRVKDGLALARIQAYHASRTARRQQRQQSGDG
jgi:hypothetical protein